MTGALGLAAACLCLLFVVWAIGHDWRRIGWHADEREAEQFSAEMHRFPPTELIALTPWQSRVASVAFRSLRPTPSEYRELAAECAETADRIEARKAAQLAADRRTARPNTPDVVRPSGKTITVKRCCNGCGRTLGDATEAELDAAMLGGDLPDTRDECGCVEARHTSRLGES